MGVEGNGELEGTWGRRGRKKWKCTSLYNYETNTNIEKLIKKGGN